MHLICTRVCGSDAVSIATQISKVCVLQLAIAGELRMPESFVFRALKVRRVCQFRCKNEVGNVGYGN